MNDVVTWIVMLAQLSSCASIICSAPFGEFDMQPVEIVQREIEDFAPATDGVAISVGRGEPDAQEVTSWRDGQSQRVATIPARPGLSLAPSIIKTSSGWWFGSMGVEESGNSVYFVRADRGAAPTIVQFPYAVGAWLPLRSSTPRGIALTWRENDSILSVEDVTPEGHTVIGTYPWSETANEGEAQFERSWAAEALPNGAIALVGVDGVADERSLAIRLVDPGRPPESQTPVERLPCFVSSGPISTALDPRGRLAVVALSPDESIVATIVDPLGPRDAECRVIAPPGEFEGLPPVGSPTVRSTAAGFIAAWIRSDGTVRATAFDSDGAAGPIIDVASDADVHESIRQLVHPDAEGVTFVWKDTSGGLQSRRLPLDLRSFAIATEIRRLLCTDASR